MMYRDAVYMVVKKIPIGKVGTYGLIAQISKLNPSTRLRIDGEQSRTIKAQNLNITPRMVGWALHANPDPESIPCHRVVNAEGRMAENYAFGGAREQKMKLLKEGVVFKDERHVDLEQCVWKI